MKWIHVSKRFPDQGQLVLCLSKNGEYYVASYQKKPCYYEPFYRHIWDHGFCCGREPGEPLYWMPLPKLQKCIMCDGSTEYCQICRRKNDYQRADMKKEQSE